MPQERQIHSRPDIARLNQFKVPQYGLFENPPREHADVIVRLIPLRKKAAFQKDQTRNNMENIRKRDKEQTSRLQNTRNLTERMVGVLEVLQHLPGANGIETLIRPRQPLKRKIEGYSTFEECYDLGQEVAVNVAGRKMAVAIRVERGQKTACSGPAFEHAGFPIRNESLK